MHSSIAENASRPSRSAMHSPYTSRSEPDQLRMSLGEQKPCKKNENAWFGLQLGCCAPGLSTPGRAFRKVRAALGGHRTSKVLISRSLWKCTEYQQIQAIQQRTGRAGMRRRATTAQFCKENHSEQYVAVSCAQT